MNRQRLSKSTLITIGIISLIALFTIFNLPSSNPSLTKPDNSSLSNSNMGKIVHIVMFEFNEGVSAEVVDDVRIPSTLPLSSKQRKERPQRHS